MSRRRWLLASSATGLVAGCAGPAQLEPRPRPMARDPGAKPVIDVHCHIFNGSDLAIRGYVNAMITEHYSPAWSLPLWPVLQLAQQFYAGASMGTPAELELLSTTKPGEPLHDVFYDQKRHDQRPRDFSESIRYNLNWKTVRAPAAMVPPRPAVVESDTPDPSSATAFRFLGYVLKPRATLALILDENSRRGECRPGQLPPVLLTPSLVEMRNWVDGHDHMSGQALGWLYRQTLDRLSRGFQGLTGVALNTSTTREQMRVMKVLSERRPDGLLIHPFVPYDPWRGAVDLARGRSDEALREVREAILTQGALGVKLYPPMGFRATRNSELDSREFRRELRDAIGDGGAPETRPGHWLDQALRGLYGWCSAQSVPLMAHTGPSHAGNGKTKYLCRADPRFWREAFEEFPGLRVNLGHFGGIWR